MEISSVQMLCKHLIFCAVQRCRLRDDPCRLSVKLTPSPLLNPPLVRISVSDTGIGSKLEEFQHLKYPNDLVLAGKWDGLISISTTGISDNEMHHLNLNIKESVSSKRLTRLPSTTKNGAKFSGSEVSISTSESVDHLLEDLTFFFKKMLILKIPMVAVELLVDYIMPGSHIESCILAIECGSLPLTTESITCLRSGLEDYVLKHGNKLNSICQSCFLTGENLKVGTGIASCSGNMQNNRPVMEAVIIISELSELATPSCFREHEMETEIFFFRDFVPCTAPQSSLDALKGISWKSYGLTLRNIKDQGGCALLEWENLPRLSSPWLTSRELSRMTPSCLNLALKSSESPPSSSPVGSLFSPATFVTPVLKLSPIASDPSIPCRRTVLEVQLLKFDFEEALPRIPWGIRMIIPATITEFRRRIAKKLN